MPLLESLNPEDVADCTEGIEATYARETRAGVCVVDGAGAKITVHHGALVVADGMGWDRRERKFPRATHGLSRLVVHAYTGYITLDALHWCWDLGIPVVVLAYDGRPEMASAPRTVDDARMRRCQARAIDEPLGVGIARYLLSAKVKGQARVAGGLGGDDGTLLDLAAEIESAETIAEARQLEATSAALYFGCWGDVVPTFAARDRKRVPPHWTRWEGRRSVLDSVNGNRKAERPVNAILNYAFSLLEAESVIACYAVGLDPGLGVVHSDTRGRDSMALDIMEPVRPVVEGWVVRMMRERTFLKREFLELPDGMCQVRAPFTHDLAEWMPHMAKELAPIAERVAHMIGRAIAGVV